jgi:serralysin
MAVIPVTRNVFQTGAMPAQLLPAGDTLNLSANAGIFAMGAGADAHGISAVGANVMNLAGGVYSTEANAIYSAGGNHTISIAATGSLGSFNSHGIRLVAGENDIANAGRIATFNGGGIVIEAGLNTVVNSGAISSVGYGCVYIYGEGNSFTNSGTLETSNGYVAASVGGSIINSSGGVIQGSGGVSLLSAMSNSLNNSGTIIGESTGVQAAAASVDTIINSGLIQTSATAAIFLGGGNDSYNGQGGRVVGEVQGSLGDDTLLGGAFVDVFRGGDNNDILNGGGGADFLDGGSGNDTYQLGADASDTMGDASGIDTVTSTITRSLGTWVFMENLVLQGVAGINGTGNALFNSIVGNGGNNLLAGQAGNDVLVGGGGNDQLFGQADKDSLTGGAGNDTFGFQTASHTAVGMGDVIVDFDDNGEDVIDLTGIPGLTTYQGINAFTAPGQVRIQQVGANIVVEINTVGNSVAEGEITILNATIGLGVGQVSGSDFLI